MSKIVTAVFGAVCVLVLALSISGQASANGTSNATSSASVGGLHECVIDDAAALRSAVVGATGWNDTQVANTTDVYMAAAERGLGDRAAIIGLMAARTESRMYNYADKSVDGSLYYSYDRVGNGDDTVGIFRQAPGDEWGTVGELMNPERAAGKFYDRLVAVDGWQSMDPGEAAQAALGADSPAAYSRFQGTAEQLVASFDAHVTCTPVLGEWVDPLPAGDLWGGYRTPDRPGHDGIDIGAEKGAEILAAAAGTVVRSKCNASLDGEPYSCDVDGSPEVMGCGWYVDIEHPDDSVTRYCHMMSQPLVKVGDTVAAGQLIGYVGSSGNSGAPHLHFQTHTGGAPAESDNATEPLEFMAKHSVVID